MGKSTVRKDCFAYNSNKKECNALTTIDCEGCDFYKTKSQFKKEQAKARKHVLSLDRDIRNHIIDSYYNGSMERFKGECE